MELTKFSQRNLDVILNFLLYAGLEEEYTKAAKEYIEEDHVDGEGSEEAILEKALSSELILEDIYMSDDVEEENSCNVYYNNEDNLIYLVDSLDEVSIYKLTKPQSEIEINHRMEVLTYRLSKVTEKDEVSLGDIFMHGVFIEQIS